MSFHSTRSARHARHHRAQANSSRSAAPNRLIEPLEARTLLSANPLPGLLIDVRLPDGGKTIANVSPGQVISLEVWATVTGSNPTGADDFLKSFNGSFLSTNIAGGSVLGSLQATVLAPFDALGSDDGQLTDLDGDGDLDIGTNGSLKSHGFFAVRSVRWINTGIVNAGSQSFKVADLTFTVQQLLPGRETQICFQLPFDDYGALWLEDAAQLSGESLRSPQNGSFRAGDPVIITNQAPDAASRVPTSPNLPPSFVLGPDPIVVKNTGPQVFPNWATHISPGNPDEVDQNLTFLIIVDDPCDSPLFFSDRPAISPDGTLTFTLSQHYYPQIYVTVLLKDDGGTANGGVNLSRRQTFTIFVNPAPQPATPPVNENPPTSPTDPALPTLPPEPAVPPTPIGPPTNQPTDPIPPTTPPTDPISPPTNPIDPALPDSLVIGSTFPVIPSPDPATSPSIIIVDPPGDSIHADPPITIIEWRMGRNPVIIIAPPSQPPAQSSTPGFVQPPSPNTPPIGPGLPATPSAQPNLPERFPAISRHPRRSQPLEIPLVTQSTPKPTFNTTKPIVSTPSPLLKLRQATRPRSSPPEHPLLARLRKPDSSTRNTALGFKKS